MTKEDRELARLAVRGDSPHIAKQWLKSALDDLDERDECVRRLLPYVGEHHDDCETGLDEGCDCGLAAAVAEAEKMLGE